MELKKVIEIRDDQILLFDKVTEYKLKFKKKW